MRLKKGRGYVPADRNFDDDLPVGYIPVDSVHSPVKKVNFHVEAARLGQDTDYDKLTLEVWTNGSVSPERSIGLAAKLIKDHMAIFINFEEDVQEPVEPPQRAHLCVQRASRSFGRRVGTLGTRIQLFEEFGHQVDPRSGSEERGRDAEDEEFRPQIAQRDQRHSGMGLGLGMKLTIRET